MNFADIILSAGRCSTEDEADTAVATMLSPVPDRKTMAEVYTTVMGYNPITYFSEIEIRKFINKILDENFELKAYLNNEEIEVDKISDMALKIHESHITRDEIISIKEAFWALCPSLPTDLADIINDVDIPKDDYDTGGPRDDDDDDDDFEAEEYDISPDEEEDDDDE